MQALAQSNPANAGGPHISGICERMPAELRPWPNNPRKHADKQLAKLKASIRRYGFTIPVLVDEADVILSGHGRVTVALELGIATVPTRVISGLSESEKRGYVIADNKIALLSAWDPTLLKGELELLIQDEFEIETTGFSTAEIDLMFEDDGIDKERLLSLTEPVRFIFSHSALREGWDNPNVFVICALKHSDNTVSRRQEVGRGLRLSVNQHGDRMDNPTTVHDVNVLTVVASESYKDFVSALQKDISESLSDRPRFANEEFFTVKVLQTVAGDVQVTSQLAKQIYKYLLKNDYTDDDDRVAAPYHEAKSAGTLAPLPTELQPYAEHVFQLVESVFSDKQLPHFDDDRRPKKNPLNDNFDKQEFKALWSRINRKAAYYVRFDSAELVGMAVKKLNEHLRVTPLQYTIQRGEQADLTTYDDLKGGQAFVLKATETESNRQHSVNSAVKYDLVGKLAEGTQLTRRTVVDILKGLNVAVFAQFRTNPEHFIAEARRLINEQKATMVVEHLSYDPVEERYELDIFTAGQTKQDFSKSGAKLSRHIYDYVLTDSGTERKFVKELDTASEVVVYAKLPRGFLIPTPVGDYNPDWAIAFKEGVVKHVYFVAETKGSMSSMELRKIEETNIACARKFFDQLNLKYAPENVKYDVVNGFDKLMELVK